MNTRQFEAPSPMDDQTKKITVAQARKNIRNQRAARANVQTAGERHEKKEAPLKLRQKLGAAATRAAARGREWWANRRTAERTDDTSKSRRSKFGDAVLARIGRFADFIPGNVAATPRAKTEPKPKLDDEPITPRDSLGDNTSFVAPAEAPATPGKELAVMDNQSPVDANDAAPQAATPECAPLVISSKVEALFDPYEISGFDDDDNPQYVDLLDEDGAVVTTTGSDGEKKSLRKPREDGAPIQFFDTSYLNREADDNTEPTTLQELTRTRAALAEANVKTRKGSLRGRTPKALGAAQKAYAEARITYLTEVYTEHKADLSREERDQLALSLIAREQGVLAGEEAMHNIHSTGWLQKASEKYADASGKKKVLYSLGAGAVVGAGVFFAGGALIGAGAAAGAAYGTRFGMNMFKMNAANNKLDEANDKLDETAAASAKRDLELSEDEFKARYSQLGNNMDGFKDTARQRKKLMKMNGTDARTLSREMHGASYAGSEDEMAFYLDELSTRTAQPDTKKQNLNREFSSKEILEILDAKHDRIVNEERAEKTSAKRKATVKAVAATAVGAGMGYALEHIPATSNALHSAREHVHDWFSSDTNAPQGQPSGTPEGARGLSGNNPPAGTTEGQPNGSGAPNSGNGTPEGAKGLSGANPENLNTPPTPQVSTEAQYLYGNLAGQNLEIKLDPGDTLWASLREHALATNKGMSFQEADRITGNVIQNITNQVNQQGYTIDYTRLQANKPFGISVPKK